MTVIGLSKGINRIKVAQHNFVKETSLSKINGSNCTLFLQWNSLVLLQLHGNNGDNFLIYWKNAKLLCNFNLLIYSIDMNIMPTKKVLLMYDVRLIQDEKPTGTDVNFFMGVEVQ